MTTKEALEVIKNRNEALKLNHYIGSRRIANQEIEDITKAIEHSLDVIEQDLKEVGVIKE